MKSNEPPLRLECGTNVGVLRNSEQEAHWLNGQHAESHGSAFVSFANPCLSPKHDEHRDQDAFHLLF